MASFIFWPLHPCTSQKYYCRCSKFTHKTYGRTYDLRLLPFECTILLVNRAVLEPPVLGRAVGGWVSKKGQSPGNCRSCSNMQVLTKSTYTVYTWFKNRTRYIFLNITGAVDEIQSTSAQHSQNRGHLVLVMSMIRTDITVCTESAVTLSRHRRQCDIWAYTLTPMHQWRHISRTVSRCTAWQ